ncbi:hypothetical protein DFH27DRAFT_564251 [Peziza echinospora]|nr:hypothetical protein DFH27DRAFT_564251 [Peziza echinospora]
MVFQREQNFWRPYFWACCLLHACTCLVWLDIPTNLSPSSLNLVGFSFGGGCMYLFSFNSLVVYSGISFLFFLRTIHVH